MAADPNRLPPVREEEAEERLFVRARFIRNLPRMRRISRNSRSGERAENCKNGPYGT
ncbi:hypothetical protein Sros01_30940 [Streptomyces roseochromogenus]|nr:hypothetical protein Sros01_30940 [Streptomyces roseochromogenus]